MSSSSKNQSRWKPIPRGLPKRLNLWGLRKKESPRNTSSYSRQLKVDKDHSQTTGLVHAGIAWICLKKGRNWLGRLKIWKEGWGNYLMKHRIWDKEWIHMEVTWVRKGSIRVMKLLCKKLIRLWHNKWNRHTRNKLRKCRLRSNKRWD